MSVQWDYKQLAKFYDNRADYSAEALAELFNNLQISPGDRVIDIGAGTGKLTKHLKAFGLEVTAAEPCKEMREIGIENLNAVPGLPVEWISSPAENLEVADKKYKCALFGSSFNVVDYEKTISELNRILEANGKIACMWNHRNLTDPVQTKIEDIIKSNIDDYSYGERRQDPSEILISSGLFSDVGIIAKEFIVNMHWEKIYDAWRSHATLQRQAKEKFELILKNIFEFLQSLSNEKQVMPIPYTTKIWYAQATR